MNTSPDERDALIEAVASAWRSRNPYGRIESQPAWHDLDDAGREAAFDAAVVERQLEAALDGRGLSATARIVLSRISILKP